MNDLTEDQVQTDSTEQTEEGQSEATSEQVVETPKGYKVDFPDGTSREMTPDELYEHYQKIGPEFTRRSQELADYKRRESETEARNKRTADEAVAQNKLLEGVDPTVRDAIVQIVSPVIQEAIGQRDKAEEQKRNNEAFGKRLTELEKKYPGGNGMPKFDRLVVLRQMQDPSNEIYDPEALYQRMNWDAWMDAQIKAAMKGKSNGVQTENTSTEPPRKPGESKEPSTWSEASKRAMSRL
jgi:hypothetical protein